MPASVPPGSDPAGGFDPKALTAFTRTLKGEGGRFVFAPVRHHSPACAAHLHRLILETRPAHVLIEAPVDFEPLIPLLLDEDTVPPVAIAAFLDEAAGLRNASYYPFCAHSPEFVAMLAAREVGAEIGFIDLPCGDRLMLGESTLSDEENAPAPNGVPSSLLDERVLDASSYTRALAAQLGCRDGLEVWDHLFEHRLAQANSRDFFADVGAYCFAIRAATPPAHTAKLDAPRERHMAARLLALKKGRGKVVVVTGGFHTSALVDAVAGRAPADAAEARTKPAPVKAFLVRYGFRQLDRLNGYGAGLPSPGFYERLWQSYRQPGGGEDFWLANTIDLFADFAAHLRDADAERAISLPVLQGAVRSAFALAELRGRPGPLRVDIQDAALSAFVKGEAGMSVEMERFAAFLSGDRLGNVPPSAGSPPLVEHVRKRARSLKFNIDSGARNVRELDIHRQPSHLEASRFLHLLSLLGVDFGRLQAGPDFLHGGPSDILFERWSWAWSPQAEAGLIECSGLGDTLERAGLSVIGRKIAELSAEGRARDARAAVQIFLLAMRAGLHSEAANILDVVEREIADDPEFGSVCGALRSLDLVWRARSVLGLVDSAVTVQAIAKAYARALYLMPTLAQSAEEHIAGRLDAMVILNEVVRGARPEAGLIDQALFDEALERLDAQELPPVLSGGLAALLVMSGRRPADYLIARVEGDLRGAYAYPEAKIGALYGVLKVAPALMRRAPGLIAAIDRVIAGVDEGEFISLLPHLRLAFATLNPGETAMMAEELGRLYGISSSAIETPVFTGFSPAETAANLELAAALRASFAADGLDDWIGGARGTADG
jgi:hypothetical protein